MEIVAAVAAVVGAIGEYEAGQSAKKMYNLQAQQATVEGERKSIQYKQRSNDVLQRRLEANAALTVRSFAGGIDPFSGSPDTVRALNDTKAGREFAILMADADAAMRGGAIQAQMYEAAGQQAARAGAFRAVAKLGMAAASASSYTSATQAPAPVEIRNV